ncbi:hypothetical protein GCM10009107_34860 [Ideonella azotifigens]|uniref:Type IV pilin Tt1218-like domain-containing protein n=1 Tax=Ideonella azotifigens TaxID=513160 RepID=A0ABN1K6P5_9BURK
MIEVLVAIFIASLGILALAGLMGTSARYGKTSEFRSVATLLAADMADRMRANADGAASYTVLSAILTTTEPNAAANCVTADSCTKAEIAAQDMATWQAALFTSLPNGTGYIEQTDTVNHVFNMWVIWRDPDALSRPELNANDGTASACPPHFSEEGAPRCMFFRVGL